MKESFIGFYSPNSQDIDNAWKSKETLFAFDTNTLLNIYSYASLTRDNLFSIFDKISDRVWIPYHVAIEYQKRRLSVIKNEKEILTKIYSSLEKIDNIFKSDFSQFSLQRRYPDLHIETENLQKKINRSINNYRKFVKKIDDQQPCVRGHDLIREKLNLILNNKIGDKPVDQAWLDNIYKEGEERYTNKIPPGFKDKDKVKDEDNIFYYLNLKYEKRFGDLIIWKQLIEKAKNEKIKYVFFITDDAKEDWWYILNSRGEKEIGPRAELRDEICRESSIKIFTMYHTSDFLENGKRLLNVNVDEKSIADAGKNFFFKIEKVKLEKYLNDIIIDNNIDNNKYDKIFNKNEQKDKISNYIDKLNNENENIDNFLKLRKSNNSQWLKSLSDNIFEEILKKDIDSYTRDEKMDILRTFFDVKEKIRDLKKSEEIDQDIDDL